MQSENKAPFVAIYIITYNHELYIGQAIDSVLMQQTNFSYKIFIGEDCSTDHTREICKKYAEKYSDRIELVLHKQNIGARKNAQIIFKKCHESGAEYIAILEGDDYWTDPLKLQKQVDFLENNKDYVLHCTNCLFLDHEKNTIVPSYLQRENCDLQLDSFFRPNNPVSTLTAMFRNMETIQNHIDDIDIWTALLSHSGTKGYYSNEVTGVYRRHYGGIMSKIGKTNALKKMKDIQLRFRYKYPEYKTIIDDTISIYNTKITKELYYFSRYKATCFYFRTFFSNNIKIKDFFYMLRN